MLNYSFPPHEAVNMCDPCVPVLCCVVQTPALQHYSGYTESSLRACAVELHGVLSAAPASQLQAVRKKYATAKANFVSTLALPTL